MVLWDISPPSSWFAGFLNKVVILRPQQVVLQFTGLSCSTQYKCGLSNKGTGHPSVNHSTWGLTSTFLPALTPFRLQGTCGLVYSS